MFALIFLGLAFIIEMFITKVGIDIYDLTAGIFVLMAGILSLIGCINSIMAFKEPISMEKIVGISVNGFISFCFILLIVGVVIEL